MPVLARMEEEGIALDVGVLREMSQGLNEQIEYLETKAYEEVGHQFNLGSPPQLSTVLFEDLEPAEDARRPSRATRPTRRRSKACAASTRSSTSS